MTDVHKLATANFDVHIRQNAYPGRGLVIGRTSDAWLIIYWIMGRSAQSRNRRFVATSGILRTEPVDASLVADPDLIIYEAMLEFSGVYLVSNGNQTRTLYDKLQSGGTFDAALATRRHEPDAPHYTSRISGLLDFSDQSPTIILSILKANPASPQCTDRFTYRPALPPIGYGIGLTTYAGDGTPLSSFQGDPLWLPCENDHDEVLHTYWEALNPENRIAIAVKQISLSGDRSTLKVFNRF